MNPLRATLAFVILGIASLSVAAEKQGLPPPTEKRIYKKVGDASLEIWIWKPTDWRATDRRSGIVFYHGGGWRGGSPNAFSRQSARLAERGMVALSAQYRLTSQPGVTVADCVKDARSAFRWVRTQAQELGLDPDKLAAGGGSAGGHLALALTNLDDLNDPQDDLKVSPKPAALALFNPAANLSALPSEVRDTDARFGSVPLLAIDPIAHVKRGHPPTIIFHGESDTTVPIATARAYAAKVEAVGGSCQVVGFPGQVHAFFNREPFVWDTLRQTESFLERTGLLSSAAPARPGK